MASRSVESFEIDSFIKGCHVYQEVWQPKLCEELQAVPEPENVVDKYAVCVRKQGNRIVGHLKKGKNGRFAKTIFYFLRADRDSSCARKGVANQTIT